MEPFDLVVVGGGVNGAGIARDAAGRGLKVLLCEQDDLAQGTSSRSGKLVHGGLRYLEYYEFRLVREALIEREVLLRAAPHIIWPMRFVLPHVPDMRPAWLVRLGLFLYDHLGGRKLLPATRALDLRRDPEGRPLKPEYRKAFEYSDCWVDDARLVVLNALDAQDQGCGDPDPHRTGERPPRRWRLAGRAGGPPRRRPAARAAPGPRQRRRPLGRAGARARGRRQQQPARPPGQGQPPRHPQVLGRRAKPICCRTPTSG